MSVALSDIDLEEDDGGWYGTLSNLWRVTTPDVLEPYLDGTASPELPFVDLPDSIDVNVPDLATAPLDLMRTSIRELGDVLEMPGETVNSLIAEAGDSRDAVKELFAGMLDEAGQSRDGVLAVVTKAIEEASGIGKNLTWAFILANLAFGALLLVGGGLALTYAGGKVDLAASMAKLLGGK